MNRITRFSPQEQFVLRCSDIEEHTNHLLLAKVWKQVHDDGAALPKLVYAGYRRSGADELSEYLSAHPHLKERIEFAGPMDEIEQFDLYRSALFAIMLSFTNGQGDVVSTCLDFSLPVIVSTHPALIKAAQGLMPTIDPNDRDGWLARILQLAENKTDLADIQRSIVRIQRPTVCWVPIGIESCNTILATITEYS